jgi:hypothetical protein
VAHSFLRHRTKEGDQKMLTTDMKRIIKDSPIEQLTEMYYELLKVNSLRLSEELRMDQLAAEIIAEGIAEVIAEASARTIGDRAA